MTDLWMCPSCGFKFFPEPVVLEFGDLTIETAGLVLSIGRREVTMQPNMAAVLAVLMRQPRHYISSDRILNALNKWDVSRNWLSVIVLKVRNALSDNCSGVEIRTRHGHGYGAFLRAEQPVCWDRPLRLRKDYHQEADA